MGCGMSWEGKSVQVKRLMWDLQKTAYIRRQPPILAGPELRPSHSCEPLFVMVESLGAHDMLIRAFQ